MRYCSHNIEYNFAYFLVLREIFELIWQCFVATRVRTVHDNNHCFVVDIVTVVWVSCMVLDLIKLSHLSSCFMYTGHMIIFFKISINMFFNLAQKDYYTITQDL